MPALSNQRIAYFNGEYVPEDQVMISFRDEVLLRKTVEKLLKEKP